MVTAITTVPTNAGYMTSFLVCALSSSSHFRLSTRLLQHVGEAAGVLAGLDQAARNTGLNTAG